MNTMPRHPVVLREYLEALRDELKVQFRAADIDRIVEEVETHLWAAIDDAGAGPEHDIAAVITRFGSTAEVGLAYRESGVRVIDAAAEASGATDSAARTNPLTNPPTRSASRPHIMDLINLGHIFRSLARRPAFTFVTVATLALGIGATAVILSVVNGVLLQPLPFPDADRLVRVYHDAPGLNLGTDDIGLSFRTYFFFKDSGVLEDLAIYQVGAGNLSGGDEPQRIVSISISHSFFDTLGVPPAMGRTFNPDDEAEGAQPVVILSDELWRSNFGARQDVLGETVLMDSESVEIVGVMPPGLNFPPTEAGLYEPMTLNPNAPSQLGSLGTNSVGRLFPGMTPQEAGAQLAARIDNLADVFPDEPAAPILQQAGLTAHVVDQRDYLVGDIRQQLWILLGSVSFVLLIACANVANVFLVRAEGREREMAIRSAMGANRGRLAIGFLAESAVLGLMAGGFGLVLALAGVRALVHWGPQQMPRIDEIGIDLTVIMATLLISLATGLLFGVIPTLRYNTNWLGEALKEGGRSNSAGRSRLRARSVLIAAQVALTLILLVGSGLMVRSFNSIAAVDPGFDPESMLTFRLALNGNDYPDDMATAQFIQGAIDSIAGMPGVEAVSSVSVLPLNGGGSGTGMRIEGDPSLELAVPPVHFFKYAAPEYFETMRISLVSGRTFERADHEEQRPSVIVNEAFADLYWPDGDAIGRRIQRGGTTEPNPDTWHTIVGVVGNVRITLVEDDPVALAYFPLTSFNVTDDEGNRISPYWEVRNPQFAVRTSGNPTALIQPVRERIWEMDPNLPIAQAQTMQQYVDEDLAQRSFTMVLLLVGAAGALLIGAVGIYGVISYVVTQQTREIGVRMALGARTKDISRMVLGRSLLITAIGITLGVGGAYFLTQFMASMLFGVDPLDPLTFVTVIAMLLAVASIAAYLPARRAARVDPLEALRQE